MDRRNMPEAEQLKREPEDTEAHEAEKGLVEQVLEALLGEEGERMLARAREIREAIEKVERMGGLFG